ncbi:MAG: BamA/TamA family outer membrane protein [Candidatus Gastranaerophilales bacterium]|nr:BamA/TamA family outer membrane protein [Candidatus Gastranaerophilales bacterium]
MRINKVLIVTLLLYIMFQSAAQAEGFFNWNPFKKKQAPAVEEQLPLRDSSTENPVQSMPRFDEGDDVQDTTAQTPSNEPVIYIKNIQITGNSLVKTEEILDAMSAKEGMPYTKDLVKVNLREIYGMGYFTDKIKAVPTITDSGVILQIHVEENIPITNFVITGNEVISTKEIQNIVAPQIGMPQNLVTINKAINEIEEYYAKNGYILARVVNIYDKPDGTIFVEINEGMIDEIKYSGNTKTKDRVIANNLSVTPNTVYNDNIMQRDIMRLYNTQAFSNVKRSLTTSEKDPTKYCLTVEVEEQRTGSISLGAGMDLTTGLFGTIGYADKNFLGKGQQTSISFSTGTGAMMGGDDVLDRGDFQGEAKWIEPRLLGSMTSMEVGAFGTSWASFQVPLATEERYGASIDFARPLKKYPHMNAGLGIGVEYDHVAEGDYTRARSMYEAAGEDFAQRADQLTTGLFISASPSIIFDTRDNPTMARNGVFAMAKLKGAMGVIGDDNKYLTASGTIKKFIPVAKKSSLVATARAGGNLVGDLPEFASYRLGGARAVRGFKEGHVGRGYGYVSGSLEYRTPIPLLDKITSNQVINSIRFATFIDAGQIISPSVTQKIYNWPGYAISAGVGLRFFVPGLGPLSLDYGIPLTNPGDGNSRAGQFTFFFGEAY